MNNLSYIKEDMFSELLYIPPHKPPVLKIIKCDVIPEVSDYQVFTTLKGLSFEGDLLTGANLIALITLNEEITYISNTQAQTIHAIHYTFLKSIIINIPETIRETATRSIVNRGLFSLTPSISSIHTSIKTPSSFNQNVLVHLEFKPN